MEQLGTMFNDRDYLVGLFEAVGQIAQHVGLSSLQVHVRNDRGQQIVIDLCQGTQETGAEIIARSPSGMAS